ncbi:tripartite tricarboxylate transporter substrate binding protein [Corynebacterium kalidii]
MRTQIRPRRSRSRRAPTAIAALTMISALALTSCSTDDDSAGESSSGRPPLNLVVPYSPGGSADGTARQLAVYAQETCGREIIIRNETGGSGTVGFQAAASATPDGNTIGSASIELSILPHLGVSPVGPDDIRGIMQYSEQPIAYGVPPNSDIESIEELLTTDEDVTMASSGTGSIYHIGFAGLAQEADQPNIRNVPYGGASGALQAVLGGETRAVSVGAAEIAPFVEAGQLRALAIAGDERMEDVLPGVPTLKEVGMDWTSYAILGLFAPADTSDEDIEELNRCLNEARQAQGFSDYMDNLGFTQEYKNASEFDAFLSEEYDRYQSVVEEAGLGGN